MKHLEISYSDIMSMPVYERRFYIEMFKDEMEIKKEKMEEITKNRSSGSKGTRTTTVSGEQLKTKLRNNQIPNN